MIQDQASDVWVPPLFGKQFDVFNCNKRILLVSGSRKSGKSYAVEHRVIRHLWETPGARIGMFAKSVKLAKDGGTWQDLWDNILPVWTEANLETIDGKDIFRVTTIDNNGNPGPKQDSQTRSIYFRVRNMFGGESELKLFSIDNDDEVASKVKNKRFSMIYFIELSMFKSKRILTVTLPQLRMPHLMPKPGEIDTKHQWIADTNPDEDLGDRSWFYKVFYKDRFKTEGVTEAQKAVYDNMHVIEMFLDDNPYITTSEKAELEVLCEDDKALYDSYVKGIHGDGGAQRGKHFSGFFYRNIHVVGGGDGEGDQIDVNPLSTTLFGGWDTGKVNHAVVLLDKWDRNVNGNEVSHWSVLDEEVLIQETVSLSDFTISVMEKMAAIQATVRTEINWVNWSDDSALNVWNPSSAGYDYMEIMAASNGKIHLNGVVKPDGSVKSRVRLIKKLLKEGRLFISSRCVKTIAMLEHLRKGDSDKDFVIWDEHKHVFDALSYVLYMECMEELLTMGIPKASPKSQELIQL